MQALNVQPLDMGSIPKLGREGGATFLTELRSLRELTVECCAFFSAKAPVYCPFHNHPTIELVYHLSGAGITRLQSGQGFRYTPHDVVLYPALMRHDQAAERLGTDVCVHLRLPASLPTPAEGIYIPPIADTHLRSEIVSLLDFRATLTAIEQAIYNHRVTALLLRLFSGQEHHSASEACDPAEQAHDYLRTHFDQPCRANDVAEAVGLSADYIRHVFKARYGMSMHQVLMNLRVAQAKNLLAHSPFTLKKIARASGFANERYLCYSFCKMTGSTPGRYRKLR